MILNADDFGLSPAVDEGILRLIEMQRLTSVSVMVHANPSNFQVLRQTRSSIDIGLHFQLTEPPYESFARVACKAYLRQIEVKQKLEQQLALFREHFGTDPDFIDGHQHVQQLPVVREAVCAVARRFKYVRVANLPSGWLLQQSVKYPEWAAKNAAISFAGSRLRKLLRQNQIRQNRYLLGYYSYNKNRFADIFRRYLSLRPQADDLFFCHPAIDLISSFRVDCFDFLASREFEDTCGSTGLMLNRFVSGARTL